MRIYIIINVATSTSTTSIIIMGRHSTTQHFENHKKAANSAFGLCCWLSTCQGNIIIMIIIINFFVFVFFIFISVHVKSIHYRLSSKSTPLRLST